MKNAEIELYSTKNINIFNKYYQIKNEQGAVLDFKQHNYLWDIYKADDQKLVVAKGAQIGFSTLAIIKSLWMAKNNCLDIIYTLPTANDVKDFVGGKVNRIINQNEIFQEWVKDKDSVEQKRVGDNVIYYRGTFTERAALMVSADLIINDEEDRSKQDIIEQYASRLQHSKYKMEWHFSNPSVPDYGVDRWWKKSTQNHWFIKCSHCSTRQYLDWPDSIDLDRKIFICKHCKQELSNEDRRKGEWIYKYKDKDFKGYWINLLMATWTSAKEIIDYYNEKGEEYFYNMVLGKPYIGGGNVVLQDTIFRNLTDNINDRQDRIVIGVDTGHKFHYVIGNKKGLFFYGESDDYSILEKYLNMWPRSIIVFDQGGDLVAPRKMREKYVGRVFLCSYAVDRKTMQLVRWGKGKEDGNVIADRNRMIQLVIDEFNDKRIPLQGVESDWWDYWLHWKNMYRVQEEDNLGILKNSWKRNGDDHWAHATIYWRTGMDKFGLGIGDIIQNNYDTSEFQKGIEIINIE
jgi:hypothetical protein